MRTLVHRTQQRNITARTTTARTDIAKF